MNEEDTSDDCLIVFESKQNPEPIKNKDSHSIVEDNEVPPLKIEAIYTVKEFPKEGGNISIVGADTVDIQNTSGCMAVPENVSSGSENLKICISETFSLPGSFSPNSQQTSILKRKSPDDSNKSLNSKLLKLQSPESTNTLKSGSSKLFSRTSPPPLVPSLPKAPINNPKVITLYTGSFLGYNLKPCTVILNDNVPSHLKPTTSKETKVSGLQHQSTVSHSSTEKFSKSNPTNFNKQNSLLKPAKKKTIIHSPCLGRTPPISTNRLNPSKVSSSKNSESSITQPHKLVEEPKQTSVKYNDGTMQQSSEHDYCKGTTNIQLPTIASPQQSSNKSQNDPKKPAVNKCLTPKSKTGSASVSDNFTLTAVIQDSLSPKSKPQTIPIVAFIPLVTLPTVSNEISTSNINRETFLRPSTAVLPIAKKPQKNKEVKPAVLPIAKKPQNIKEEKPAVLPIAKKTHNIKEEKPAVLPIAKKTHNIKEEKPAVLPIAKKPPKIKEEKALEECLEGAPPFVQEVFKCDNIRNGFINEDLVWVLSLYPDMEEMSDTQKILFQLKVIDMIDEVMNDPILKDK